jgi:hypothetical protein
MPAAVVMGEENEREKISWFRPVRTSSIGMHGVPRSSRTVRIMTMETAFDAEEGLVDAVDLQPGRVPAQQFHHPGADVPVELVVAGSRDQAPFLGHGGEFEPRLTHGDAQGFGFGGAGDGTAVVVGEHDDGGGFLA